MIEFDQVQHAYHGTQSVNGVSFYVERGEAVSLLGPSDAAKQHCYVAPLSCAAWWLHLA